MLLQALHAYAETENLIGTIEITDRPVHLVLLLRTDGSVDPGDVWQALSTEETDAKGNSKVTPGRVLKLPSFPGVNSGGKANFLADEVGKVLGIDSKTGEPFEDEATSNSAKSFRHFWQRIVDAHAATGLPQLRTLLEFRDRYLGPAERRRQFPGVGFAPVGKKVPKQTLCALIESDPVPLEKRTVFFKIDGDSVFNLSSPLHVYWKDTFARERFAETSTEASSHLGLCLVTGEENQPIAESHRTPIKGVPGLPPIGGYLVSFDDATPSLRSYGLEKAFQAPVSEHAAAAYALGLNDILARDIYARRINDFVICAWIHEDPEETRNINGLLIEPTEDAIHKFHEHLEYGSQFGGWSTKHFRSVTLAANGGRVVVRRWLDQTLVVLARHVETWFHDLELKIIPPPDPSRPKPGRTAGPVTGTVQPATKVARPYRALDGLAWSTARTAGDVRSDVYDALYRAAYEKTCPHSLLPALLHRLRIAAVQSGSNVRYHAGRFALIKLIINRTENIPMAIETELSETRDAPYNCGRLLAVLDDIQYKAQGDVGASILARFYGNASTFPCNVFPRLLRLARSHLNKIARDEVSHEKAFERKLNDICALIPPARAGGAPEFPRQLDIHEQGRFALGFYQQKAKDQHERDQRAMEKKARSQKPE